MKQVIEQSRRVSFGNAMSGDLADPSNDLTDQNNGANGSGIVILNVYINK